MPQINPETNLNALNNPPQPSMGDHLGIEFTDFGPDFLSAKMPVSEYTTQPFGILHGGASAALAETLGSVASILCVDVSKQYVVGLELNINHLRSVPKGETVFGTAKALHLGRRTHVWDIKITNAADKLVATSRLTVMVVDHENHD